MISLANDLLRKSSGYTHEIPEPIKKPANPKKDSRFKLSGKYLDEQGKITSINKIARKYKVSECKVRRLFSIHDYREAYRLMNTDLRANNHAQHVYFMSDGTVSTGRKLASHYGVSLSKVQRTYAQNSKDYRLANKALEEYLRK